MGVEQTRNKSQHTKLTPEKRVLPPLLPGFEFATFQWQVWHTTNELSWLPTAGWPFTCKQTVITDWQQAAKFPVLQYLELRKRGGIYNPYDHYYYDSIKKVQFYAPTCRVCTGERPPNRTLLLQAHPRQFQNEHYSNIRMVPASLYIYNRYMSVFRQTLYAAPSTPQAIPKQALFKHLNGPCKFTYIQQVHVSI